MCVCVCVCVCVCQVETGSAITWKYPSVVLAGDNSVGEFYSVALTNNMQQVSDTHTPCPAHTQITHSHTAHIHVRQRATLSVGYCS